MNECVDDSIRFVRDATRQRHDTTTTPTDLAPRLSRVDVLAPTRVSVSRIVVESARRRNRPVPPPTPTPNTRTQNTHTRASTLLVYGTRLGVPPREIKNKKHTSP